MTEGRLHDLLYRCSIWYNLAKNDTGRSVGMATVSFDKSVVIEEPEAVDRLVESLLNDEPRKLSENLISEQDKERGEQLLMQCLSPSNA